MTRVLWDYGIAERNRWKDGQEIVKRRGRGWCVQNDEELKEKWRLERIAKIAASS